MLPALLERQAAQTPPRLHTLQALQQPPPTSTHSLDDGIAVGGAAVFQAGLDDVGRILVLGQGHHLL